MPMILDVGPLLSLARQRAGSDQPLEMGRESPTPFWSLELPGLYGLEPLSRIAAGLGVNGECPPPLTLGEMDWDLINLSRDIDPEPFPTLNGPAGQFSGDPALQVPDEVADLRELKKEVEIVLQHLTGPQDIVTALREVGSKPFSLEWCLGSSLHLACDIALAMELPLTCRWRYPRKDPDLFFGYLDAFYWGLGEITEASLDGKDLQVRFVGGYSYRIPLDYILTWDLDAPRQQGIRAKETSIDEWGYSVTLLLADGKKLNISDVSILAGCEPSFEHFGGWTEKAKKNVRQGYEKYGPF